MDWVVEHCARKDKDVPRSRDFEEDCEIDGGAIAGHCWWQFEMQTVAKIESFVGRIPWCFVVSCSSPPFRSRLEDHKLGLILFALS